MKTYTPFGSGETSPLFYAPDVARVATGFVNLYFIGTGDRWIVVDTGLPGFASHVLKAARNRFGPGSRPAAIVLTHAHFDHAGNAEALATEWSVPVYAHLLERPYLTGVSDYPPQDPTVGGAIAFMSRAFPHSGRQLSVPVLALPEQHVPFVSNWRWLHTPGHTAGHVSLFRESDGLLIAGDALSTMNLDSWRQQVERRAELCIPPTPMTTDWTAARQSVERLAALEPRAIGAGHGVPVSGRSVAAALRHLADSFAPPAEGRYTSVSARTGPAGVEWVPPQPRDRLAERAALGALAGGTAAAVYAAKRRSTRGETRRALSSVEPRRSSTR